MTDFVPAERSPRPTWFRALTGCLLVVLATPVSAGAASLQAPTPLGDERILFEPIDVVSAASRFEQPVSEAPSSVTIITAEEIRQMGYRTLAEALQGVRGLFVTDDHNYSFVGVRGFARPGDYNTRVLLLVDGLRLNDPVFDTALVGTEGLVDMALVERIEVVRGPSSSVYGPNAFFAVINIVTAHGRDLAGLQVLAEGGSLETGKGRATWGKRFAGGADLVASASYYRSRGATFYFPEFDSPETGNGVSANADRDQRASFFAKLAVGKFTLTTALSDRTKRIPTGSYGTIFNDPRNQTRDEQDAVDLRYETSVAGGDTLTTRAFYNRYAYDGTYMYEWAPPEEASLVAPLKDYARGERLGAEVQYRLRPVGRHRIVLGGEIRGDFRQDQGSTSPEYSFADERRSHSWGLFAQDDVKATQKLTLSLGLRYDRYASVGGTASPRFGVIFSPGKGSALKLLFGRAYRPPNVYELYYDDGAFQKGNPGLSSDTVKTYEAAWESSLGPHLRGTVAAYVYRLDNLISQTVDPSDGRLVFANSETIDAKGVEAELAGRWPRGFEGRASYALQRAETRESGLELTNSPRHLLKLYFRAPLVSDKLSLGIAERYMSRRLSLSGGKVDGFALTDLTLLGRGLFRGLDVSVGVFNLFDARYYDPGSEEHVQDGIQQYGRTVRVRVTCRF